MMTPRPTQNKPLRIGLVVPHIFLQDTLLPHVIFSPGQLAIELAKGMHTQGAQVTLFSPGPVSCGLPNQTADLTYFKRELAMRGDTFLDLLRKHPFTFITLARQVQAELIAKAYVAANSGQLDIVHIYTNEEELAMPFAALCRALVVFTHHDPFNFLVKYKNNFPKHRQLNWISMSLAQRNSMPTDTNWVGNIYHGIDSSKFTVNLKPRGDYIAYLGRIVEPKGVHMAIAAAKKNGLTLKIAGKHYAGYKKDAYWQNYILPHIDGKQVEYVGFLADTAAKQDFLGNAQALLVPSLFEEPFGMVTIESLACGTPVIGFDSGATPEIIQNGINGFIVQKQSGGAGLATALSQVGQINRADCRADFDARFTLDRMCREHLAIYRRLIQ